MTTESRLTDAQRHKIADLVLDVSGPYPEREYGEEMIETVLRLLRERTGRGDLKLINSALKEIRFALGVFSKYKKIPKVTAFGSARTKPSAPEYKMAKDFGQKIVKKGFMVITGAAGGIMQACNEGAGKDKSFGVNIRLPFEQSANAFIDEDKLINFKYFFTRKLFFVKESDAIALFPGGFGTMDEAFELFTLVQTGKSTPKPIVLVDVPGGSFWKNWENYVRGNMEEAGLISPEDLSLFYSTHDVDSAVEEITRFYRVYHSSRYVDKNLVIRLKRPIGDATLAKINREFKTILAKGDIVRVDAFEEELQDEDEMALPRLALSFNRRDYGLLRRLIDRINEDEKN